MHIPVKKETEELYRQRYLELKRNDKRATHDQLMRNLLGFR